MRELKAWAGALVLLCSGNPPARAEDAAPAAGIPRSEAIRDTLAGIEKQAADHGGWEKWAGSLKPYRDDIVGCVTNWQKYKWPWPAKNNYVFQGAAIQVQRLDAFDNLPEGERPFESILHFDRQLKALGIDLIVAIIPAKMSIYPDYMYAAVDGDQRPARAPEDRIVSIAVLNLMHTLLQNDVEVVNLHEAFRQHRIEHGDGAPLYYVRDGHYRNRGARVSAAKIAERLRRYDFVQAALAGENPYVAEKGARTDGEKADDDLLVIKDRGGRPYRDRPDSPILVLGDSHLWYNSNTAALFSGQLACLIGMPVALNWQSGLSGTIPVEVAKDPNLRKRRVVILHYTERALAPSPGKSKWPIINLPGAASARAAPPPAGGAALRDAPVTGVVAEMSPPPDVKAPYPHYVMKLHLRNLADAGGAAIGAGDAVVQVLAMHNRRVLPVAATTAGQELALRLTSWPLVEKRYGRIQAGNLPTLTLEIEKPVFWGSMEGQPDLSDEELARIEQEDSPEKRAGAIASAPVALDPANADWRIDLDKAVNGTPLVISLSCREGKPAHAFAMAPRFNKAVHDVDPTGLTVADGRASGRIAVRVNPDAWVPRDGKPVQCRFEVDAAVADGKIAGSYKGVAGEAEVSGAAGGQVQPRHGGIRTGSVELSLNDAVKSEQAHARVATIKFRVAKGAPGGATIAGFHPKAWNGRVTRFEANLTPETLTAEIEATVSGGITQISGGTYTFALDGKVAGGAVAGTFKARCGDENLPGGAFSGKIDATAWQDAAGDAK